MNCADCQKPLIRGQAMFPVSWYFEEEAEQLLYWICKECLRNELREGIIPGGLV